MTEEVNEITNEIIECIQHGDIDLINRYFQNRYRNFQVTANLVDTDNCSLLQWAAINNRVSIAKYLVHQGADVNHYGGVLGESAVQWALRRKYYRMMDYLIQQNANIHHKSLSGTDCIQIACRSGNLIYFQSEIILSDLNLFY